MNRLLPTLFVLLTACEVPLAPTDFTPAPATRIEGVVEVDVDGGAPGGPAILVRYDCANPPPPVGTGTPADFLVVEESAFQHGRDHMQIRQLGADAGADVGLIHVNFLILVIFRRGRV